MPVYWIRSGSRNALRTMGRIERALAERDTGQPGLEAALSLLQDPSTLSPSVEPGLLSRIRGAFRGGDAVHEGLERVSGSQRLVVEAVEALGAENRALRARLAALEEAASSPEEGSGPGGSRDILEGLDDADPDELEAHEEPAFWKTRSRELDLEIRALRERLVLLARILPVEYLDRLDADLATLRGEASGQLFLDGVDGSLSMRQTDVEPALKLLWERLAGTGSR